MKRMFPDRFSAITFLFGPLTTLFVAVMYLLNVHQILLLLAVCSMSIGFWCHGKGTGMKVVLEKWKEADKRDSQNSTQGLKGEMGGTID